MSINTTSHHLPTAPSPLMQRHVLQRVEETLLRRFEGTVTADCQFCGAHYEFDPQSLGFEATVDADGQPLPDIQHPDVGTPVVQLRRRQKQCRQ